MKDKLAINNGTKSVPDNLKKRWPIITEQDKAAVMSVLDSGMLAGTQGVEVTGLEKEWAEFVGAKHALAVNTGTSAIHTALYAAGVGPGDEVITTAFTFSGTFHPVLHQNAIPVFVDIDPNTYNIDVSKIEAKISEKTKVLMPVHIHGLPCEMDEIMALAEKYNLIVIEDACQAHGATYKGKMAGTIGHLGVFSMQMTKNLSGAEGGLVVTDDDERIERVRRLRTYGERTDKEDVNALGFRPYTTFGIGWNYRTQELSSALARNQLKRLNEYNAIGQRNAEYLSGELAKIAGITPPQVPSDRTSIYHKYRIRFDPEVLGIKIAPVEFRNKLIMALRAEGVAAYLWHFDPVPSFPIFKDKDGYGKGCPWSCPFYGKEITYDAADYPESTRLLETSFLINDEPYPIYCQSMELMEYYVQAVGKVFDNIDEIIGIES